MTNPTPENVLDLLSKDRREIGMSCRNCAELDDVSDGIEYGAYPIYVCAENPSYENLTSFPFKKPMKCFHPSFWHTVFAEQIDGTDESHMAAMKAFMDAVGLENT